MPLALFLLCALHDSISVERRVDSLMARMTIEQKLEIIGGVERAFSYWDHGWRLDPGQFVIYVGDSSEHTPLSVPLDVAAR
jgi:hypothetical protein